MPSAQVAIIDSGGANIASLQYALQRLGADSEFTSDEHTIRGASHVILPGVGAAQPAMAILQHSGMDEVIPSLTQPVLGICLGMQLLATGSEEDDARCLGILPETACRLPASPALPVPNMGWCQISTTQVSQLLSGIADGSWFYFVHSYALPVNKSTVATAEHAMAFSAVMTWQNFHGVQFHPERSAQSGARLLENFLGLSP